MNLLIYLVLTVVAAHARSASRTTTRRRRSARRAVRGGRELAPTPATHLPGRRAGTPRRPAVLRAGDKIIAINGTAIDVWDQAVAIIEASAGKALTLDRRARRQPSRRVAVTPVENVKYANDTGTKTITAGYIGVWPRSTATTAHARSPQMPGQIGSQIASACDALGSYPRKIAACWHRLRGQAARPQRRRRRGRPRPDRRRGRRQHQLRPDRTRSSR